MNPQGAREADERDRERAQGKVRGPLHGIPIALKDNIHTTDMPTTGGALAFEDLVPPYEATLTKNLRDAGAIIIAKTGMTELANWVAGAPTPMPGNYNAVGGYGFNPYDPRRDPREATFDGRPALQHRRIELRRRHRGELLGRQRRHRDVRLDPEPVEPEHAGRHQADGRPHQPLRRDSDHRRPGHRRPDGARRSADAAIMLGALESAAPDPNDPATRTCTPPPGRDYTKFLKRDGLKGARIGIPRAFFYDRIAPPGEDEAARGGLNDGAGEGDGRGDRRAEAAGRRHRRSGGHPERRRHGSDEQLPAVEHLLAASNNGQRQGRELLDRLQVRHEARLQRVARSRSARRRR